MAEQRMIKVTSEQANAIVNLAYGLKDNLTQQHIIVGITTDGVPVVKGIEYVLSKSGKSCRVEYIGASSKLDFIDKRKLDSLKQTSRWRIFVDWRTVTGKLGQMLKASDSGCLYAVLSDRNNKADIRATTEDVPKLDFPEDYKETANIIGLWTEPHTIPGLLKLKVFGGEIKYTVIATEQSKEFYGSLFKSIDSILEAA